MSTEETVTPVETLPLDPSALDLQPLERYEMAPDRVEIRLSIETADLRVEISVEGLRGETRSLKRAAEAGLDAAMTA